MATNRDTKAYPGGLRNRIHRIVMRTGDSVVQYSDSYPGQSNAVRSVIDRTGTVPEPPVERSLNDGTKTNDV